jgi:hypothetical protein
MTTDARARYLDVLLKRLEAHEGPVADAERYMERLDVLAGVDVAQKQLTAGTPLSIEERPPEIEHGSDRDGTPVREALEAAPRPEGAQQAPVSASDETSVSHDVPPPAAPSPEAVPAEPYTAPSTPAPRLRNHRDNTLVTLTCSCGCGETFEKRAYEVTGGNQYVNAEHYRNTIRKTSATAAAVDKPVDISPAPSDVAQIQEPATNEATQAAPALITESVCKCPIWWRGQTPKWSETIANEGHHDNCPLFKQGVHSWPYPDSGAGPGPHKIMCRWCRQTREVDGAGLPWDTSPSNPAVGEKGQSWTAPKPMVVPHV